MSGAFLEIAFPLPLKDRFLYRRDDEGEGDGYGRFRIGCRVSAYFGKRKLTGWIVGLCGSLPEGLSEESVRSVERLIDAEPLFDPDYLGLARWIADFYLCSLGEALAAMLPGGRREREVEPLGLDENSGTENKPLQLSEEQNRAVETILDSRGNRIFYLYGITGSGKTEVFLRAAENIVRDGRGVLYLVPEISLTHQLLDTVRGRFGGRVAALHSHLTPSQKLREWRRIQSGEADLVVGARGAVFAPLKKIGLIIVDEEHETSYKSGSTPRYHARQVAMRRAAEHGSALILGSATPSVEVWRMMREKKCARLDLTRRLSGGSPPRIETVQVAGGSVLSRRLMEEISLCRAEGGQTILFLNRRGYSFFYHCKRCQYVHSCKRCSVSLTYHKQKNALVCHYCGFRSPPVNRCPECGALDAGYGGFGTEQVEGEVRRLFPALRIARFDADTTAKRGSGREILRKFADGELDLLLGTQMVAKGLNFPRVKLVGIVLADTTLRLPDFRASERAFGLITQVAGRAGRFRKDGRVVVQSWQPDNPTIRAAAAGSVEEFYSEELKIRELLGFPPYSRLVRIVFRGRSRSGVEKCAADWAENIRRSVPRGASVMGPVDCPLAMIAGNHRVHLVIKSVDFNRTHHAIARIRSETKPAGGVYVEIDLDPQSMM